MPEHTSAETLRRAAALMRETFPLSSTHDSPACKAPSCRRRVFHQAVADWLDGAASRIEAKVRKGGNEKAVWSHETHALAVARAYLGEAP